MPKQIYGHNLVKGYSNPATPEQNSWLMKAFGGMCCSGVPRNRIEDTARGWLQDKVSPEMLAECMTALDYILVRTTPSITKQATGEPRSTRKLDYWVRPFGAWVHPIRVKARSRTVAAVHRACEYLEDPDYTADEQVLWGYLDKLRNTRDRRKNAMHDAFAEYLKYIINTQIYKRPMGTRTRWTTFLDRWIRETHSQVLPKTQASYKTAVNATLGLLLGRIGHRTTYDTAQWILTQDAFVALLMPPHTQGTLKYAKKRVRLTRYYVQWLIDSNLITDPKKPCIAPPKAATRKAPPAPNRNSRCYILRAEQQLTWKDIALEMDYKYPSGAIEAAKRHAKAHDLPWPITPKEEALEEEAPTPAPEMIQEPAPEPAQDGFEADTRHAIVQERIASLKSYTGYDTDRALYLHLIERQTEGATPKEREANLAMNLGITHKESLYRYLLWNN